LLERGIFKAQGGQEMGRIRKRFDGAFKARVALAAIKGEQTTSEIAASYSVHPNQVSQWKKQVLEALPEIFSEKQKKQEQNREEVENELYRQIGQLKVELDWLKKKSERLH
jgi:putative transposase